MAQHATISALPQASLKQSQTHDRLILCVVTVILRYIDQFITRTMSIITRALYQIGAYAYI